MAMPPDGSSGWRKSADIWSLESAGAPFVALRLPVAGHSVSVDAPCRDTPHDSRTILRLAEEDGAMVVYGQGSSTGAPWRAGGELLDDSQREIVPYRNAFTPVPGAAPIARWSVSAAGVIELFDSIDRLRMRLSPAPGPAQVTGGTRVTGCRGAVVIDLFEHPGTTLRHGESSQP